MTTTPDLVNTFERITASLTDLAAAFKDLAETFKLNAAPDQGADDGGLFNVEETAPEATTAPPPHRTRNRRLEYLSEKRRVHRVGKQLVLLSHSEVAVLLVLRDLTVEKGLTTFDDGVERFLDFFEVSEHARGLARERGRHALSALTQPLRATSANYGDRPVIVMRYPGVLGRAVLELTPEFLDAPKKVPAQQSPAH